MQQLGTTFNMSNELLREAIGAIYGHKHRYYPFGSLTTDPSCLPSCQDATYKHNYYAFQLSSCNMAILLDPTWTWLEGESKQHFHRLDELHTCPQTCFGVS